MWRKKSPVGPPPRTNVGGEPLKVSVRSEPIVGYRMWRVKIGPAGLRLWALNVYYEWQVENTAACQPIKANPWFPVPSTLLHEDPSPSVNCACGLYAALPEAPLQEWDHSIAGLVHASGTVALTGRVIRCTLGYKAEHAEIQAPVVLEVNCIASTACPEPVVKVDVQKEYARGWCADHAPKDVLDASQFMAEAVRQLSAHYQLAFLSWNLM